MELKTINVQVVLNLGNYQSLRIGGEWSAEAGLTFEEMSKRCYEELKKGASAIMEQQQQPKEQQQQEETTSEKPEKEAEQRQPEQRPTEQRQVEQQKTGKEKLTMENTKIVQQIVRRIEQGVKLEKVLEYYEPDENVTKIFEAAAMLVFAK